MIRCQFGKVITRRFVKGLNLKGRALKFYGLSFGRFHLGMMFTCDMEIPREAFETRSTEMADELFRKLTAMEIHR
jgi:hypothetical protein